MGKRKRIQANNVPDPATYANHTPFRQVERKYKQKHLATADLDLSEVYDAFLASAHRTLPPISDHLRDRWLLSRLPSDAPELRMPDALPVTPHVPVRQALRDALGWPAALIPDLDPAGAAVSSGGGDLPQAVVFPAVPGLILLPAALPRSIQTHLTHQSIAQYTRPPNKSNMTAHWAIPAAGLWPLRHTPDPIPLHAAPVDPAITPSAHLAPEPAAGLLDRLRWCTLGFQYHWTTKTYVQDEAYPFPADLAAVTHAVVHAVEHLTHTHFGDVGTGYPAAGYKAEAGVLNVYGPKDTLMAHVDESEPNMRPPLVSISLAAEGVFLIGGPTRDTRPIALRVRSGDVVVMSAGAREAFHGVPRILDRVPEWMEEDEADRGHEEEHEQDGDRGIADVEERGSEWRDVVKYLKGREARVNLNVRQVH